MKRSSVVCVLLGLSLGLGFCLPLTMLGAICGITFAFGLPLFYRLFGQPTLWQVYLIGIIAHCTVFHWMPRVIGFFGNQSVLAATLLFSLFVSISSLQFVLFELLRRRLANSNLQQLSLELPLAWFAVETLLPKLVPWTLGHTLVPLYLVTQVVDLFGSSFLSFILLWFGSLLVGQNIRTIRRVPALSRGAQFSLASLLLLAALGYSGWKLLWLTGKFNESSSIQIGIVQPNLDLVRDFKASAHSGRMQKLWRSSSELVSQNGLDLLIWPESAVGYDYHVSEKRISAASGKHPFPGIGIPIIFGGQTRLTDSIEGSYYNSAYALNAQGEITARYDKQLLVPFAEHNPLAALPFVNSTNDSHATILPAHTQKTLGLPYGKSILRIAAVLCYEDMFTELFASLFKSSNPQLLLSLSNNAWFLDSIASAQHHHSASFRALEFGRFLIRVTNNGISGVVDPLGRTIQTLPPFTQAHLSTKSVHVLSHQTFFVRFGKIFAQSISALLLVCMFAPSLRDSANGS